MGGVVIEPGVATVTGASVPATGGAVLGPAASGDGAPSTGAAIDGGGWVAGEVCATSAAWAGRSTRK